MKAENRKVERLQSAPELAVARAQVKGKEAGAVTKKVGPPKCWKKFRADVKLRTGKK